MVTNRRAIPEVIGRYEVILPIASGGMATVYLARQHGLAGFGRDVAVKLMHAHLDEEEHWRTEFIEEAKLAAAIRHPNVVEVVDVGQDAAGTYLVMSYIEGESLAGLTRSARGSKTPIERPVALRILADALAGLQAAHVLADADGHPSELVHRDFSPQNVLVGTDGISRLTDFGIAKAATRLTFTSTGTVKGKIAYMSPEQARGQAVDRRCDVWAAGVVAWELFANRRLFPAGDDLAVGLRVVNERVPDLREIVPSIPDALALAVASALERDLTRRCPTAEQLSRRLGAGQEIAPAGEVARFVDGLVRDKLVARRARAMEVARLRREMGTILSTADSAEATPSARRAADEGAVAQAPRAFAVESSLPVPARVGGPGAHAGVAAPRPRVRRLWWSLPAALAASLLVAALPRLIRGGPAAATLATATLTTTTTKAAFDAGARSGEGSDAAAPVVVLLVVADVPLVALRVGARDVIPEEEARTLRIELGPEELAASTEVEAVTADGRRATSRPAAGSHLLTFTFGQPDAGRPARPASRWRPARVTAPAPLRPGLAGSPYEASP